MFKQHAPDRDRDAAIHPEQQGKIPAIRRAVVTNVYPFGWWWANELVRGKYLNAAGTNVYSAPNSLTANKHFSSTNVFKCPEGFDDDIGMTSGGDFPCDAANNGYTILNDPQCAQEGLGVPCWYMLNSRVANTAGAMRLPGGTQATPFCWFNSSTDATTLQDPGYQRYLTMVHKPSELIMIVEASSPNWYDQNASTSQPALFLRRLGARHGQKTADKRNAFTNFAFFDGHVGLYPTLPYQKQAFEVQNYYRETIFFVTQQRAQ